MIELKMFYNKRNYECSKVYKKFYIYEDVGFVYNIEYDEISEIYFNGLMIEHKWNDPLNKFVYHKKTYEVGWNKYKITKNLIT